MRTALIVVLGLLCFGEAIWVRREFQRSAAIAAMQHRTDEWRRSIQKKVAFAMRRNARWVETMAKLEARQTAPPKVQAASEANAVDRGALDRKGAEFRTRVMDRILNDDKELAEATQLYMENHIRRTFADLFIQYHLTSDQIARVVAALSRGGLWRSSDHGYTFDDGLRHIDDATTIKLEAVVGAEATSAIQARGRISDYINSVLAPLANAAANSNGLVRPADVNTVIDLLQRQSEASPQAQQITPNSPVWRNALAAARSLFSDAQIEYLDRNAQELFAVKEPVK